MRTYQVPHTRLCQCTVPLRRTGQDWLTNQSTLSGIDDVFGLADIPLTEGIVSSVGARRTRVRGYYASLDPASRSDFRRFSQALADVMERLERQHAPTPWWPADPDTPDPLAPFQKELAKLGYAYAD